MDEPFSEDYTEHVPQPEESSQQELRSDLTEKVDHAIAGVRDLVSQLNEREKECLHTNSVAYRQLVDMIADWALRGKVCHERERLHILLEAVHEWFLLKAPEHYKGCGLCLDVEEALNQ